MQLRVAQTFEEKPNLLRLQSFSTTKHTTQVNTLLETRSLQKKVQHRWGEKHSGNTLLHNNVSYIFRILVPLRLGID